VPWPIPCAARFPETPSNLCLLFLYRLFFLVLIFCAPLSLEDVFRGLVIFKTFVRLL